MKIIPLRLKVVGLLVLGFWPGIVCVAWAQTFGTPKPFVPLVRPAERQVLYATGSNGLTVYAKGKEIVTNVTRDAVSDGKIGLREGDVIAVKNEDRFDINSFWMLCLSANKEFLFQVSDKWQSYVPADSKRWWETKGAKEVKPVQSAPDSQQYVIDVKKSAAGTPFYSGSQPIRSVLQSGSRGAYLYYVVTREDLLPKDPPPSSAK